MTDWIDHCHFGDCRELTLKMPATIADACITDPPYGDTSLDWDRRCAGWIMPVARVLKPAASIWVFGSMRFVATLFADMNAAGFRYAQEIVWRKQNGTGFHNDRFRRVHEFAIHFYRGAWEDVFKDPQYSNDATARTVRRKTRPTHTGHIDAGHYVSEDGGPRLIQSVIEVPNETRARVSPDPKAAGHPRAPDRLQRPAGWRGDRPVHGQRIDGHRRAATRAALHRMRRRSGMYGDAGRAAAPTRSRIRLAARQSKQSTTSD